MKKAVVPLLFTLATSVNAAVVVVDTDTSWLTTGSTTTTGPAAGWNTNPSFDTTGWTPAVVSTPNCMGSADCIWFDLVDSATRYSWFRHTFNISGPIVSATFEMGVDDDAEVYLNGVRIVDDKSGASTNLAPFDISSNLVNGDNLIAVFAEDNIPVWGQLHAIAMQLRIETQSQAGNVPEPGSLALLALGAAGVGLAKRRGGKGKQSQTSQG